MSLPGTLSELRHLGTASALYLTGLSPALSARITKPAAPATRPVPVLLPHGIGHNRSWAFTLARSLGEAGFVTKTVDYPTLSAGLSAAATALAEEVLATAKHTQVDVVAHSLGGLVVRAALTDERVHGLVRNVVTLGAPHKGTPAALPALAALPGVGPALAALRPNSAFLAELDASSCKADSLWTAVGSVHDLVVPGPYAVLEVPVYEATNITLSDIGHMGLMHDPVVVSTVLDVISQPS